jgi:hypothetical protein
MQHVPIDLEDLAEALDDGTLESSYFVDLKTGTVLYDSTMKAAAKLQLSSTG